MSDVYHSIIGLPRSGKTTFLAALWHVLDAGEVSTSLVLDKLVGDHRHLNTIVEAWRQCDEVPRTSMAGETRVAIHVHQPLTDRKAVLSFPDLSGESFERQLTTRTCQSAYVKACDGDGGLLLFLTANRPLDGIVITDLAPAIAGAVDQPGETREWTPQMVPEQVRIVELLQFLQQRPFQRRRRKVGLIVSAWDVILDPQPAPIAWLQRELPLVHQFLMSNRASFDSCVYGVSAQGGDLHRERDALLRVTPSERIKCVGPGGTSHDITEPVTWLMAE